LEEAKNINSSLTSLGMVINALSDGAPHVPYRDSKLTMLLMEALGGNSKTTLIICCNPETDHSPETLSTLRFGERAKHIQTNAKVNEELSAAELKALLVTAKKDLEKLVLVIRRAAGGVSEAIATGSVVPLPPVSELLKKHMGTGKDTLDVEEVPPSGASNSNNNSNNELQLVSDAAAISGTQSTTPEPEPEQAATSEEANIDSGAVAEMRAKVAALEEEVEMEKLR
jgi:kinesin family member 5